MKDVEIELEHRPGALAAMGDALGAAGVSVEGGGAWVAGGRGVAHFLFEDGDAARRARGGRHRERGVGPGARLIERAGVTHLSYRRSHEADDERARDAVPGGAGGDLGALGLGERAPSFAQQRGAGTRQLDPAVVAAQELDAEIPLEGAYLLAQRGLRDVQPQPARPKCSSSATAMK